MPLLDPVGQSGFHGRTRLQRSQDEDRSDRCARQFRRYIRRDSSEPQYLNVKHLPRSPYRFQIGATVIPQADHLTNFSESSPSSDHLNALHPLLYSLDVFLPFVDLHQEHYWWPDEGTKGECTLAGRTITIRGSSLRLYLWMQIIAGWLLSAIFVAGITGLIRNN